MNRYGLATVVAIVTSTLMTVVHCNAVHHHQTADGDNLWVVMSGMIKLEKPSSVRLCGTKLDEVLSLVCRGHYNKRTLAFNSKPDESRQLAEAEPVQGAHWYPSKEVVELTESVIVNLLNRSPELFSRKVRSANRECCQSSCSLTTLRSYCRESSTTNMPNMTPDSASE